MNQSYKILVFILLSGSIFTSCGKDSEPGPKGDKGDTGIQGNPGINGDIGTANDSDI